MRRPSSLFLLILALAAGPLRAQAPDPRTASGVAQALAQYDSAFRRQDPDAIAAFFLRDGVMGSVGHPSVTGPDSISARLRQYAEYRLVASTLTADSVHLFPDSAAQFGHYRQRVRLPAGDTVEAHGTFTMTWVLTSGAGWRLRRMITDP